MTERARDLHEHDEREEKHTRHSQTSTSRSFQTVTFRQHTRGRNAPRPAAVTHATPVAVHGPPKFAWHRNSPPPADVLRHGPCGRHHRVGIRIPTRALERHLTGHRATRGSNQQSRMEVIRGRVRSRTVAIAPGSRGIIWIARAFPAAGTARCIAAALTAAHRPPNVRPTAMDQCAADYTLGSSTRHAHHNATRIRPTKPTGNRHEYN